MAAMEDRKIERRPYATPELTVYGSVESITATKAAGDEDAHNTNPGGVAP
jgi:hypothetical protein